MNQKFSVAGQGSTAGSTGPQNVSNGSTAILVASIDTHGVGAFSMNLFNNGGTLSDFSLAFACADPIPNGTGSTGASVPRLVSSAGDFANVSNLLNNATASPHSIASGTGSAYIDLDLKGRVQRIDVYAKSVAGAVVTIDAVGVGINVG